MDPDLSEFEEPINRGPICSVEQIRRDLAKAGEEQKLVNLDAALTSERILGTKIAGRLNAWGFKIRCETVQRHRRGACDCGNS